LTTAPTGRTDTPLGREYPRNRTGHRISEVGANRYPLGAVGDAVVITMLGLGSYVLHSIANMFIFDLTTHPRYDLLTPRGPADRRLAACAVHWRMRASPVAAEIWGRCSPSHSGF
jgi:hypothetical protein